MERIKTLFRFACLLLCTVCLAPFARAATLDVPAQYANIGAAVTAANTGDAIQVADGTYTGAGNRNIDFGGKNLTVQSASGNPAKCVIDCQQSGCAFILQSGKATTSRISGFTITNGTGHPVLSANYGGGIYISQYNNSAVVDNCVFIGNAVSGYPGSGYTGYGGGVYGGTVTNCAFLQNSADDGYGGGMDGGAAGHCVFIGNSAYGGGGMAYGMATDCVFTGNSAEQFGGGMEVNSWQTVINCVFTGNSSRYGGGLYSGAATHCVFTGNAATEYGGGMQGGAASNCIFTNNTTQVLGGGMSSGTATNCVFTGNTAANGGGAYASSLYFCSVTKNTAQTSGGGVYHDSSFNPISLTNCIVWDNASAGVASNVFLNGTSSAKLTVSYSDIQGGFPGTGNINADPLFVNAATGNLHLTAASPCINAGVSKASVSSGLTSPTTDIDGGKRTVGGKPDMGAYEFGNVGVFGTLAFTGIASTAPAQNVAFEFRPVGGGAAVAETYFTTSDGAFYHYDVPDGNYNLWMKSPTYLAGVVAVTVTGGVASIAATLQPGDANNDNSCDTSDFGILVGSYGSDASSPGSGYDPTADFNGDGSIDTTDFGLLVGSYGQQGAP